MHLGLGAFFRAHGALLIEDSMQSGGDVKDPLRVRLNALSASGQSSEDTVRYFLSVEEVFDLDFIQTNQCDLVQACGVLVQLVARESVKMLSMSREGQFNSGFIAKDFSDDGRFSSIRSALFGLDGLHLR